MTFLHAVPWRQALGAGLLALAPLAADAQAPAPPAPETRSQAPEVKVPAPASQEAAPAPEAPSGRNAKQAGTAARDMVAAANPLAAEAGRTILAAGGSAVDAAVAVQLVLNLVEPQSSGIGGGAFLLHWDGSSLVTLDGRETAPAAARPERFLGPDGKPMTFTAAVVGGRSVGVPGTVRLLEAAHRRWGRLPWARLFEPALRLAEEGFPISPRLNGALGQERFLQSDAIARAHFYQEDGTPKPVGTVLKNPAFVATLRLIAERGAEAFYTGAIATDIVAAVTGHATNPGDMTLEDLKAYRVEERAPVFAKKLFDAREGRALAFEFGRHVPESS